MKYINKVINCPLWIVSIIICFISYTIDTWYTNMMFNRWTESECTDKEAYAVCNHHDNFAFIYYAIPFTIAFWAIRKLIRKKHSL